MDSADLSRDSSGTRSFSQFIVELADRQPLLVLPSISLLLSHLDGDVSFSSLISVSFQSVDILDLSKDSNKRIFKSIFSCLYEL